MPETIQNLDQQQPNPLMTTDLDSTDITPKPKKGLSVPKDPKIIILGIMGVFIVILLLLSLIVTASRQKPGTKPSTDTSTTITPTKANVSPQPSTNIPEIYKARFDNLDTATQEVVDFPPPQVDSSIGITPNQ